MSDRCKFCGSKNLDYNEEADVMWCEAKVNQLKQKRRTKK